MTVKFCQVNFLITLNLGCHIPSYAHTVLCFYTKYRQIQILVHIRFCVFISIKASDFFMLEIIILISSFIHLFIHLAAFFCLTVGFLCHVGALLVPPAEPQLAATPHPFVRCATAQHHHHSLCFSCFYHCHMAASLQQYQLMCQRVCALSRSFQFFTLLSTGAKCNEKLCGINEFKLLKIFKFKRFVSFVNVAQNCKRIQR